MLRDFRIGALTAGFLLAAAPVAAQVRPDTLKRDTVYRVTGIVVQAVRPVTTIGGSSALEVRIDSMALPAAPTMEMVLRELPMFHVRTNSRGESEISVRGSESRQVAVLVDGVPLTLAWDARADLSVLPASSAQEISFIRGLSSMLYGPNVLGGIVEIGVGKSFFQPTARSAQLTAGYDHVGGYGGSATIGVPGRNERGEWLIRAGGSFRDSPGQPLGNGVSEPLPGDDDLRLNTDADNANGFVAFRYHDNDGAWLSFSGSSFRAERGIAAELGVTNARFWRYPHISRTLAVLSGGTGHSDSPFGGLGDVELSLGLDVGRTEIDSYTSRAYSETNGFENGDDRTVTLRALADQDIGARSDLRAAFTWTEIRHDESVPDGDARYRQRLLSLGLENNWRLIESGTTINTLRLPLGGAFDVAETPESGGRARQDRLDGWGGRIGLSASVAGGSTLLHAGVSRRGRFPALRELYSGALNRFEPNPDLRPENLVAIEAGVTMRVGTGELQLVGFRHELNDAVVRITRPDRKFFRVNRNQLESRGVEVLATQTVGPVQLGGDLTVQSVELTNTETAVTNQPENLPEVFGSVNARFPLALGIRAIADANYIGKQFCIDPGTGQDAALKAGTQVNVALSRTWTLASTGSSWRRRVEGRISADNAGDIARYDQCGLPQPGRLVQLQVRLF